MNTHLILSLSISTIVDLSFIGLFILILLFFVIRGFISMHKGIFKTGYKFIMFAILVLVAIFTLEPISKLIGSINLSSILPFKTIIYTNTDAGVSYNVTISSLYHTIQESVKGLYLIYGISSSVSEATALSISLADSIIKLVTFIIDLLLIYTLGYLFIVLTYHLFFKHLIPKIARRKLKLKIPSFIIGGINYIVAMALFISPLSSLVNIVNQSYQRTKSENDTQLVKEIGTYIDAYNNSIIANLFFNWTVDDQGLTIDSQLMDYLTSTVTDNVGISIYSEINNLMDVVTTIGNAIVVDENGNISEGLNYSYLLSQGVLENIFSTLKGSNLVIYLIPIAFSFATNIPALSSFLDTNLIEDESIDWNYEFENLETVTIDLINSGIVDIFVDRENNTFDFTLTDEKMNELIQTLLSEESYGNVYRVLSSIDNSKLLKNLLPIFVYSLLSSNPQLATYFPHSYDELSEINWGFELATTYNTLYKINKIDDTLVSTIVSLMNNNSSSSSSTSSKRLVNESEEESGDNIIKVIISKLLEHPQKYIDILIGETDKNGNLTNIDENGYSKVKSMKDYRLFDLRIIQCLMKSVIQSLPSLLSTSEEMDTSKLQNAVDEILSDRPIKNIKTELLTVINILSSFNDIDSLLGLITGEEALIPDGGTIADIDDGLISALITALPLMENSKILSNFVFPLIESAFSSEDTKNMLLEIGLDVNKFDFDADNLGHEYAHILGLFDSIKVILDILSNDTSDLSAMISSFADSHVHLARLLDGIYNSQIFNPSMYNDESFYAVINYLFEDLINMTGLSFKQNELPVDLKWNNTQNKNGDYYYDKNGEPIYDGEIGAIINIIRVIGKNNILEPLQDFSSISSNIGVLETTYHISELFYSIDDSKVFSLTMGDFLDSALETTGLIDNDLGMTFNNVTSWSREGDVLKQVLTSISILEIDLSNIDLTAVKDVVELNNLLHSLSDSSIFVKKDTNEFLFPKFIEKKLIDSLSSLGSYDIVVDPNEVDHDIIKSAIAALSEKGEWNNDNYVYDFDKNQYVNLEYAYYYENPLFIDDYDDILSLDEIGKIVRVVYYFKDISDISNIDSLDPDAVYNLLTAINKTDTLDIAIYNIYDIAKVEASAYFSLDSMNHAYLLNHEEDEVQIELSYLRDLLVLYKTINENEEIKTGIQGGAIDVSDLDASFISEAKNTLKSLNKSYVFHRYDVEGEDLTIFQNIVNLVLSNDVLSSSIYDDESPKDIKLGHIDGNYSSSNEKTKYLIKNVFPSNIESNFDEQVVEIDNVFNVINSFIGGEKPDSSSNYYGLVNNLGERVYSLDQVDFKNSENIIGIKDIICELNDSKLLMDCAVNFTASTFKELDSEVSFNYLKISEVNFYYQYDNHDGTYNFFRKIDTSEIDLLIELLDEVNKYLNLEVSAIPNFNDLNNLDVIGFNGLLDEFANSYIFHRGGPVYSFDSLTGDKIIKSTDETTVFQQLYIEFLTLDGFKDYYYSSSSIKDSTSLLYNNALTKAVYNIKDIFNYEYYEEVYVNNQNGYLVEFLKAVLGLEKGDGTSYPGLSNTPSGNLDFSSISIENINVDGFIPALEIINESDVFFDIVPNMIDEIMSTIDGQIDTGNIHYIRFELVNTYYQYYDEAGDPTNFDARYTANDFKFIKNLLEIGKDYLNNSSILNDLDLFSSDLAPIKDFMKNANISNIAHRGGLKQGKEITFFQSIIKEFFSTDLISNSLFSSHSMVDNYYSSIGLYTDSTEKIDFLIKNILSYNPSSSSASLSFDEQAGVEDSYDEYDDLNNLISSGDYGEVGKIMKVVESLRVLSNTSFDFANIDLNELSGDVVVDIFNSFVDTSLIYDCVPNIIYDIFTNIDSTASTIINGISFSDASVYYYLSSPTDYNAKFPSEEIINIGNLLDDYNELNAQISNSGLSSSDFSNISQFNDLIIDSLKNLGIDLYNSHMLHQDNQYLLSTTNLTVYEQYVNTLLTQSTLVTMIYKDDNSLDASYTSGEDKLFKLIKSMTAVDENNLLTFRYHSSWNEELTSLFDFFKASRDILTNQGSSSISSVSFDKISPENMEIFLVKLNDCDIICDAESKFVNDGLNNVGLESLAVFETKTYLNRYLTQSEYRDSEISTLINMLDAIAERDSNGVFIGYADISNPLDFVNDGYSLSSVFDFLTDSLILNVAPFESSSDYKLGRDIVTFNIFDSVSFTDYISGSTDLEKINLIKNIYSFTDMTYNSVYFNGFSSIYEGSAIKKLIETSSSLTAIDPNIESIQANKELILETFEICYDSLGDGTYMRSYFASEIIGNILEAAIEDEYSTIEASSYYYEPVYLTPTDLSNINNYDYYLFNVFELNGLNGALSMCDIISTSSIAKSQADNIRLYYSMMGDYDSTTGLINYGYGNSKIASIYHLSRVDSYLKTLSTLITYPFTEYTNDIYSSTFSFEDYGNSIADYVVNSPYIS
ncbi:MAG: hypothetical protein ACI31G_01875 [Bacilli bacterium]